MGALGISYIISNLINKKKLNTIIKNNTKINKIYFPQKNINKYLAYKYKKYKKLRESLNYIW